MRQVPRFTICSLRCGRQEGKVIKILVVISFNLSSSPGQLGAISKNNSNGITLGIYIYMREFALLPWSSLVIDHSTLHRFGCLMMVKHSRYMPDSGEVFQILTMFTEVMPDHCHKVLPFFTHSASMSFLSIRRVNFVASLSLLSVRKLPLIIAKVSNFLLFCFQITWKSESITLMTSSRSVYTRMYAAACLKNTNSYSRSWCASEFWWTTTRLTWLVHTDILVFLQFLLSFLVVTCCRHIFVPSC